MLQGWGSINATLPRLKPPLHASPHMSPLLGQKRDQGMGCGLVSFPAMAMTPRRRDSVVGGGDKVRLHEGFDSMPSIVGGGDHYQACTLVRFVSRNLFTCR